MWLENEMVAVVTSNGYVRFLQYGTGEGVLMEDQHKPCEAGVFSACLCKLTGHVAIASASCVTFFDPLLLSITGTMTIPQAPDGVRYQKLQGSTDGEFLLLGRSDGQIFRLPIPKMTKLDLTLLSVRRRTTDDTTVAVGITRAAAAIMLSATCGRPRKLLSLSAGDGATCGFGGRMFVAWSHSRQLLAVVNDKQEIVVVQRLADGSMKKIMKEGLPDTIISLSWDPTSQSVLAIAIRGHGIALWDTKTDHGVQMWSGMSYKGMFTKGQKQFDPAITTWNLAGQLAVGMQDGTFAVWDSMSMDISTSGSTGKHKSAIQAAAWYSSMFSPALALASKSTIKVSQGFEGVEWSATAMKLKLAKERRFSLSSMMSSSSANDDLDGLTFEDLQFSPNGKFLGALAVPVASERTRVCVVYELQDERKSLVLTREVMLDEGVTPIHFRWLVDNTIVLFCRQSSGAVLVKTFGPNAETGMQNWPESGKVPGTIVDAAATPNGLLVIAMSMEGSKGQLVIVTSPSMHVCVELPLEAVPQTISVTTPKGQPNVLLTVGLEGGGVDVFELPPGGTPGADSAAEPTPPPPPPQADII